MWAGGRGGVVRVGGGKEGCRSKADFFVCAHAEPCHADRGSETGSERGGAILGGNWVNKVMGVSCAAQPVLARC